MRLLGGLVVVLAVGCGGGDGSSRDAGGGGLDAATHDAAGGVDAAGRDDGGAADGGAADGGGDGSTASACSVPTELCECVAVTGCGWCWGTNSCMEGDASGAADGTCNVPGAWTVECVRPDAGVDAGPAGCEVATDCASCTALGRCGWCGATGTCVESSTCGPVAGSCASGFSWSTRDCPAGRTDGCPFATDCASCTAMGPCGWCGTTARCLSGTATGPCDEICAGGWSYFSGTCM